MLYQILVLITPIITTPYLSRVLGAQGIGIFSYAQSIAAYFILFGTVGSSLYGPEFYRRSVQQLQRYAEDHPSDHGLRYGSYGYDAGSDLRNRKSV